MLHVAGSDNVIRQVEAKQGASNRGFEGLGQCIDEAEVWSGR